MKRGRRNPVVAGRAVVVDAAAMEPAVVAEEDLVVAVAAEEDAVATAEAVVVAAATAAAVVVAADAGITNIVLDWGERDIRTYSRYRGLPQSVEKLRIYERSRGDGMPRQSPTPA